MKKKFTLAITCFMAAMLLLSVNSWGQTIIDVAENGDFEHWTEGNPDNWMGPRTSIAAGNVNEYTTAAYSGDKACQLVNTSGNHTRFTNEPFSILADTEYTVTYYVRGQGEIRNAFYRSGSYSGYSAYTVVDSDEWTEIVWTFEYDAPVDDVEVIFSLMNTDAARDHLQIDNVTITYEESEDPELYANPNNITGLSYVIDSGPSGSQSFEVSGINMDGSDVTITAPANFEISDEEAGAYGETTTLTSYDGSETNIWVRLAAGLLADNYSGDIEIYGGGVDMADAVTVALSGKVVDPFGIPYVNVFRTDEDRELAEAQGFTLHDIDPRNGYTNIPLNGYIETPEINFTEYDYIKVLFSTATFGGFGNQELELQISSDGETYEGLYTALPETTTYDNNEVIVDLTGAYDVPAGTLRFIMTSGSNQTRFRDLSIEEHTPAPTFDPEGGRFHEPVNVTIETITEGSTIYYSFDSDDPASGTWTEFTTDITVDVTTTIWAYATKDDANSDVVSATYIFPTEMSIYDIRYSEDPDGTSPHEGEFVSTSGIVTAGDTYGFYMQDGVGAWNGIYVYTGTDVNPDPGSVAEVTGEVGSHFGMVQITDSPIVTETGVDELPAPYLVSTGDANSYEWQGLLIKVEEAVCVSEDHDGFGRASIDDGSGELSVDRRIYDYTLFENAVYNITGVGYFSYSTHRIAPRSEDDIKGFFPITFNVDMSDAIVKGFFEHGVDNVDVAGDFNNWGDPVQNLTRVDDTDIYTFTTAATFEENDEINFKFRINGDWDLSDVGDNREYTVVDGDNIIDAEFRTPEIGWANLQWPDEAEIMIGNPDSEETFFAQVWINDVTGTGEETETLNVWIGLNNEDTDPATWDAPDQWAEMSFAKAEENNDEYSVTITGDMFDEFEAGTYYYATRFQYGDDDMVYGGFDGGFWDGTDNVSGVLTLTEPLSATIDPTSFDMYVNWDNENPEFTITWNDASVVTGMSYYDEDYEEWVPLPEELWEVTGDDGTTATLVIDLDAAPEKEVGGNEYFIGEQTWRVEFDLGDPALGTTNLYVKTFFINIDVEDEQGDPVPDATIEFMPYADNDNPGDIVEDQNAPEYEVLARRDYKYIVQAEGYITETGLVLNVKEDDTVDVTLKIDDTFVDTHGDVKLAVFPNPAREKFTVESNETIKQIRLIDINGKVVIDVEVDNMRHEINVNNLQTGIYFMQIHTTESVITERVQIAR